MRTVHATDLVAGNVLAKPIYGKNGMVMLKAGTILSDRYIQRLRSLQITEVTIEESLAAMEAPAVLAAPLPRPTEMREAVSTDNAPVSEEQRKFVFETLEGLPESGKLKHRSAIPMLDQKFNRLFKYVIQDVMRSDYIVDNMARLHMKDDHLYRHSLNVAVLSGILGVFRNYTVEQLTELIVGAMLFDIGMLYVPTPLLQKTGTFTRAERQTIESHTRRGFELLMRKKDIPRLSALCALQHHERYNGSGYPNRFTVSQIHEYAQIVSIVDVYDALISPRHHRVSYSPNEAAEYLLASGDYFFDLDLIQSFYKTIAIYPVSSKVQLNTGQIAIVNDIRSSIGHRPIVKVIVEADGKPAIWPYEIDLEKEVKIVILKAL